MARKDMAEHLIDATDIRKYCECVHVHIHNKARQVQAVIDTMDLKRSECLMMGDLPSDAIHAKEAGIHGLVYVNEHVPRDIFGSSTNIDFATTSFVGLLDYIRAQE